MRCAHWTGRYYRSATQCRAEAVVWLHDPEGQRVPGCHYCQAHADATVNEYREKLGEEWTARPVDWLGNLTGQPDKGEA